MKIIAFGHRRWVGKSTAAKFGLSYFRTQYSALNSVRFGFADSVKDLAHRMYGWAGLQPGIYYENHPTEKEATLPFGKSPRQIWIELGEAGRRIAPITWAELGFYSKNCDVALISDLRDPVEADYVKLAGGYLIKIVRPGTQEFDDSADSALKDYAKWDGTIVNRGSLADLNGCVKEAIERLASNNTGWEL